MKYTIIKEAYKFCVIDDLELKELKQVGNKRKWQMLEEIKFYRDVSEKSCF